MSSIGINYAELYPTAKYIEERKNVADLAATNIGHNKCPWCSDLGNICLVRAPKRINSFALSTDGISEPIGASSPIEFSIGHLVQNKEEVDSLMKRAESAGAIVTGKPHERPSGIYSGYFKDLDGHLWEIIWNPQMLPD